MHLKPSFIYEFNGLLTHSGCAMFDQLVDIDFAPRVLTPLWEGWRRPTGAREKSPDVSVTNAVYYAFYFRPLCILGIVRAIMLNETLDQISRIFMQLIS